MEILKYRNIIKWDYTSLCSNSNLIFVRLVLTLRSFIGGGGETFSKSQRNSSQFLWHSLLIQLRYHKHGNLLYKMFSVDTPASRCHPHRCAMVVRWKLDMNHLCGTREWAYFMHYIPQFDFRALLFVITSIISLWLQTSFICLTVFSTTEKKLQWGSWIKFNCEIDQIWQCEWFYVSVYCIMKPFLHLYQLIEGPSLCMRGDEQRRLS